MNERIYGYIRVSTREQNEDRQLAAMSEFGVPEENLFRDKQSDKDFDRPAYRKMMAVLQPGDTLVIKSIDRLGRNYTEILEQWRVITKEKRVAIVVLDLPLLDMRRSRDLTGVFIADIVLQLLSYVAETERRMNRQRQAEGIAAARRRGRRRSGWASAVAHSGAGQRRIRTSPSTGKKGRRCCRRTKPTMTRVESGAYSTLYAPCAFYLFMRELGDNKNTFIKNQRDLARN